MMPRIASSPLSGPVRHGICAVVLACTVWGCSAPFQRTATPLPVRFEQLRGQLIIHTDFELPQQHRLIAELDALRGDLAVKLRLPTSDEPIHVYLFESDERFKTFIGAYFPELPARRAFFVKSDTRLAIYAHWGDRVAEDLRHEVTHGYVHAVLPNLPLWLDEGLAEYFEVARGQRGLNGAHVDELTLRYQDGTWRPHPERLEQLDSAAEMSQTDYAEAWAWVHLLLETSPERTSLLHDYLQRFDAAATAEPLSQLIRQAIDQPEVRLVEHLQRLDHAR